MSHPHAPAGTVPHLVHTPHPALARAAEGAEERRARERVRARRARIAAAGARLWAAMGVVALLVVGGLVVAFVALLSVLLSGGGLCG